MAPRPTHRPARGSPRPQRRAARPAAAAPLAALLLAAALAAALAVLARPTGAAGPFEAGARVRVGDGDGLCVRVRARPSTSGRELACVPDGGVVTALADRDAADGYHWEYVRTDDGTSGWMADAFLAPAGAAPPSTPSTTAPPPAPTPAVPQGPAELPVPPPGGFTMGLSGATDPAALVAAQDFEVAGVWLFDIESQSYLSFVPGAPAAVNTLDSSALRPGSVVTLRRRGDPPAPPALPPHPAAPTGATVSGTPFALPVPPAEGFTQGVSGVNDPDALARAQPFEVRSIWMLHVPSQSWLNYFPGAPVFVNSLARGILQPGSVVTVRAGAVPTDVEATITYYYCRQGTTGIGDGGGFCGHMANGEIVHPGAAACHRDFLGQRFRVAGDPLDRIYTCKDTGSAVRGQHRDIWFDLSDDGASWIVRVGEERVDPQTGRWHRYARIEILPN